MLVDEAVGVAGVAVLVVVTVRVAMMVAMVLSAVVMLSGWS